jgi:hypothetical protein
MFEQAKTARTLDGVATTITFTNILICVLRAMQSLSLGRINVGAGLLTCVKYSEKHFGVNLKNKMVLASQNYYWIGRSSL